MIRHHDYLCKYGLKWSFFLFSVLKEIISFNIKDLKLYIEQDSFNKLKGGIYELACTCRCNRIGILLISINIFQNILVLIVEQFWVRAYSEYE